VPRLLILSNRLPVTLRVTDGEVSVEPSAGGLTTALRALHEGSDSLWIGWSGAPSPASAKRRETAS
jgi:trehalose 6-phosphate synthase/phosphatase